MDNIFSTSGTNPQPGSSTRMTGQDFAGHGMYIQYPDATIPANRTYELPVRKFVLTGACQMLVGFICIALETVSLTKTTSHGLSLGSGIYCSAMFVFAGVFSIESGRQRKYGFVKTCMILSILAALLTIVLLSLNVVTVLSLDESTDRQVYNIRVVLAMLSILEGGFAILSTSLCCRVFGIGQNNDQIIVAYPANLEAQAKTPVGTGHNQAIDLGAAYTGGVAVSPQDITGDIPTKVNPVSM